MRIAAIVLVALLAAITLTPEEPPPTTIRADVSLVQLHATVVDTHGRMVSGLGRGAFELFVDGVRQPITVFQGEDVPVTAGIVIDNSASMAPKRADVIMAAMAFARAGNPRDQMFVVHFSDRARFALPEGTPFTGDAAELQLAISSFQLGGTTALYDALMLALTRFEVAAYSRKVLLLITDGEDNSSIRSLEDTLTEARKREVSLFAIDVFEATDRDRNPKVLTELADATGGRAFFPATSGEAPQICERIAGEIRQQYALGFAGARDARYHAIRLTANDPRYSRLTVKTREGYLAPKP